jgi:hypothetical protein
MKQFDLSNNSKIYFTNDSKVELTNFLNVIQNYESQNLWPKNHKLYIFKGQAKTIKKSLKKFKSKIIPQLYNKSLADLTSGTSITIKNQSIITLCDNDFFFMNNEDYEKVLNHELTHIGFSKNHDMRISRAAFEAPYHSNPIQQISQQTLIGILTNTIYDHVSNSFYPGQDNDLLVSNDAFKDSYMISSHRNKILDPISKIYVEQFLIYNIASKLSFINYKIVKNEIKNRLKHIVNKGELSQILDIADILSYMPKEDIDKNDYISTLIDLSKNVKKFTAINLIPVDVRFFKINGQETITKLR